ncbi:MAG: hypothetical protein JNK72_07280 [Myxococcales bacterium]|nr:hypothetical protein [Myxococcales bacterium]
MSTRSPSSQALLAALAALSAGTVARTASAQTVGTSAAIDAQTYWPSSGATEHLGLRSPVVAPSGAVGFGLTVNMMGNPLVLTPPGSTQRNAAIERAITADFMWHVGIARRFQLSAAVPVVLSQSGLGTGPVLGSAGSALGETALRDIRIEASWAIVQRPRRDDATGLGLRLDLGLAVPFGDDRSFQGAGTTTFAPMAVADYRLARFTFTANVGARVRGGTQEFADFSVGSNAVLGAGVSMRPIASGALAGLGFSFDYLNYAGLSQRAGYRSISPQELFFGARYATDAARDITVFAGATLPLGSDPLTPSYRVVAGLAYAPRGNDTDGDGIVDADDRCRTEAEDRDGYEDEDGCPDNDNDSDGVADRDDRCPDQPEDADNHDDADGCPDDDNDGDAVQDADDQCPNEAAGAHPDPSREGCPIPDTDSDGVLDPDDRCVDVAAGAHPDPQRAGCPIPDGDGDGVADGDDQCPRDAAGATADRFRAGCPDLDVDRDGVLGEADRCADQPETVNGVTDDDGCPDQGPEAITWEDSGESIHFARPVVLAPRQAVLPATLLPLIPQIAQRLRGRGAEVARVIVEVMPGVGAAGVTEAERQAGLVVDALIGQRISARTLRGAALPRPTPPAAVPGQPRARFVPPRPGTLFVRIERRS